MYMICVLSRTEYATCLTWCVYQRDRCVSKIFWKFLTRSEKISLQ